MYLRLTTYIGGKRITRMTMVHCEMNMDNDLKREKIVEVGWRGGEKMLGGARC